MDMERYRRQIILSQIGEKGQQQLLKSQVLIVGCGALGTVVANNLCRAGIGTIKLVDRDVVELSNLQRQILFNEQDVGLPKAVAAQAKLLEINSQVQINGLIEDVNPKNVEALVQGVDLVVDATDNFSTRLLINDVCVKHGIPWIYGGVIQTHGMVLNINDQGACFRCLLPQLPEIGSTPTCETDGVLNTIVMIIGSIQSNEAIKILTKSEFEKKLIVYDVWTHSFALTEVVQESDCPCCIHKRFDFLSPKKSEIITNLCANSVQILPPQGTRINLIELAEKIEKISLIKANEFLIQFEHQGKQVTLFQDGRAIVKGTGDFGVARSIYSRYVGN